MNLFLPRRIESIFLGFWERRARDTPLFDFLVCIYTASLDCPKAKLEPLLFFIMAPHIISIPAKPTAVTLDVEKTALIIIDMQRDFLLEGGFGESLGNDVTKLQRAVDPCKSVLEACRHFHDKMLTIHTREGHRPQEVDIFPWKQKQVNHCIGKKGAFGRILIRGSEGHDFVEELYPRKDLGEFVLDKPGKGSFYATDLELILRARNIETLLLCGVTTEVCVHSTVREANDRGFECLVIEDACASYIDEFHESAIKMIWAQGGIFGSVTTSGELREALLQHVIEGS